MSFVYEYPVVISRVEHEAGPVCRPPGKQTSLALESRLFSVHCQSSPATSAGTTVRLRSFAATCWGVLESLGSSSILSIDINTIASNVIMIVAIVCVTIATSSITIIANDFCLHCSFC